MPTLDSASGKLRRSIGIMGGTFDPIHHGHLVAASEVMDVFQLDQVIFVPTAMQPFKAGRKVTPAEHRYLMTVIATASNPRFSVSRVDIDRGGTTYTIDTLHDLRKIYPDADFYFITGADALTQVVHWKDADLLFEKTSRFVGVLTGGARNGNFFNGLPQARRTRKASVVLGARWGCPIHQQIQAVSVALMQ